MIEVTDVTGAVRPLDEDGVAIVNGPYPSERAPHTYVHLVPPAVVVTTEAAEILVSRMPAEVHFARLTRPDGTPVWINVRHVRGISPPTSTSGAPDHPAHAVVQVGPTYRSAVLEDVATAKHLLYPQSA